MIPRQRDADRYRSMAEECRTVAEDLSHEETRHSMRECAAGYERMAADVERALRSLPADVVIERP